jgi:glucokinase
MDSNILFAGVDVGGTNVRAALVQPDSGEILVSLQAPTLAREGHAAVLERILALVQAVSAQAPPGTRVGAVGIGLPGKLDPQAGVVEFLPNLPGNWPGVPAASLLADPLGLPVFLINDARAMTLGEWACGAGRGVDTIACFTLGTGIGGGLVVNGRLHLGINGTAGELGHMVIDANGPPCGCGGRGCLEVFASGPAITALGVKAVLQGLTTQIGALVDYDLNHITPQVIADAAKAGDGVAGEIIERVGTYLGIGVANIIISVGPRRVILGGGVARLGDLLFDPVRRTVRERVFLAPADQVEIVPAELGQEAGLVGAAVWAKIRLQNY